MSALLRILEVGIYFILNNMETIKFLWILKLEHDPQR